jgi:hypothetical protein
MLTAAATAEASTFTATDAASRLAQRVHESAGGSKLDQVAELRFTFVVMDGDKKLFEAAHKWDRLHARDRVAWTDKTGTHRDVVVDLASHAADDPGYARWVNDSYWLMLPLKLLDPGVHRKLEDQRDWRGKKYDVLRLSFDHVGLTPGDMYWLYVDPTSARIERWEMKLEGQKEPPHGNDFSKHTAIGPLTLALDHVMDDGKKRIVFEGVESLNAVVASDFTAR